MTTRRWRGCMPRSPVPSCRASRIKNTRTIDAPLRRQSQHDVQRTRIPRSLRCRGQGEGFYCGGIPVYLRASAGGDCRGAGDATDSSRCCSICRRATGMPAKRSFAARPDKFDELPAEHSHGASLCPGHQCPPPAHDGGSRRSQGSEGRAAFPQIRRMGREFSRRTWRRRGH